MILNWSHWLCSLLQRRIRTFLKYMMELVWKQLLKKKYFRKKALSYAFDSIRNTSLFSLNFMTLHKKWSFPSRISVNVIKSSENCGFDHIYWRNSSLKSPFFVHCQNYRKDDIYFIWPTNFQKTCHRQHFMTSSWN